jgi:hypothetical protein
VRDNSGFALQPGQLTLATILHARGYHTAAWVSTPILGRSTGLDQGFDTYADDFPHRARTRPQLRRPADEVVSRALSGIRSEAGSPFFAWLHFYDAHAPYDPPEPYRSRYAADPYAGALAFVDAQIGRLLRELETDGLLEHTIVVAVGDHGESLGDHGEWTHGLFVYETVLHVPLIVRAPGGWPRGRRVSDQVRTVDILPTVLALAGIDGPLRLGGLDGEDLSAFVTDRAQGRELDAYAENLYPARRFGWSPLRVISSGRYKLIETTRPELYDLEADPRETRNLYDARRALADRLQHRLAALARDSSNRAPQDAARQPRDPEAEERLAALGYITGHGSEDDRSEGELEAAEVRADVKDRLATYQRLLRRQLRPPGCDGEGGPTVLAFPGCGGPPGAPATRSKYAIHVHVVTPDRRPLAGAHVEVRDSAHTVVSCETDQTGRCTLADAYSGDPLAIHISRAGFISRSAFLGPGLGGADGSVELGCILTLRGLRPQLAEQ